jgi:predicted MFS family arabinose efflux permease
LLFGAQPFRGSGGITLRKAMSIRLAQYHSRELNRALAYERRLVRIVASTDTVAPNIGASGRHTRLVCVPKVCSVKRVHVARPQLWTREFVHALLAGNAYGYAFSSFILLPVFMVSELGSSPTEIGHAAAAFGIAAVAVTPLVARFVDRYARGRLLAGGAIVLAVSSLAFVGMHDYGSVLLALRALQGAAFSLVLATMPTLVAEIAPPERMGEALGMSGASMLVMNALAPAIGEPLAAAFGWTPVFVLAAVAGLVSAGVALQIPARERSAEDTNRSRSVGLLSVMRMPVFAAYAQITLLCALTFGTMFTFLAPYLLEQGLGRVSDFFAAYAGSAVGIRLLAGQVPDRFGRRPVALAMMAVYALVPPAALLADSAARVVTLGAVFGAAHGLMHPSINALALASARPHERGCVMALFSGAFCAGAWGGGLAFGPIAENLGYPVVFALGGFCCVAGLALFARCPELGRAPAAEAA